MTNIIPIMKQSFKRKTYGRIFVPREQDIKTVINTIKEVDEFEYEYLPNALVTTYDCEQPNDVIYLHKFEICKTELTRRCIEKGIWIWCIDGLDRSDFV